MKRILLGSLVALLGTACGGATDPATTPPADTATATAASTASAPAASSVASAAPPAEKDPLLEVVDAKPTSPSAPAALYAELFKKGAKWKVSIDTKRSTEDGTSKPKVTTTKSTVTCSVTDMKTESWGLVSHVECPQIAPAGAPDALTGWWIATSVGLFHSNQEIAKGTQFDRRELVALATPTAAKVESTPREGEDNSPSHETRAQGASWCRNFSVVGVDPTWNEICVEAKKGFVGGKWGWAGPTSEDHTFTATLQP